MRIYLASIGWIEDAPAGNRLRWTYPTQEKDGSGNFIGFPESVVVERARLDEDIPDIKPIRTSSGIIDVPSAAMVPITWWEDLGTVSISGIFPLSYKLTSPAQAVSFTYHGSATRLLIKDSEDDQLVAERMLSDGDTFYLEASSMDEFIFLTFSADLQDFRTLDLMKDRGLDWETIAEIRVRETWNSTYEEVQMRYDHPPSITLDEFEEIKALADLAIRSTPEMIMPDRPSPWQIIDTVLGVRWEFALLFGYAFFDGPRSDASPIDTVAGLLESVPTYPVAYRVRDKSDRVGKSNVVVCPPVLAKPLSTPSVPQYIDPTVRLTDKGTFDATLVLRWQQFDARAIGVEVEEEIGASPSISSMAKSHTFFNRSHRPEDPPFQGSVDRSFDVPFYDVNLRARIRAQDSWDRVSTFSSWTGFTPLLLYHEPWPPSLASARFDDMGRVHVLRQGNPGVDDWQPDVVVKHASGRVNLYRSRPGKNARVEKVNVRTPINIEGRVYKTNLISVPVNSADFEGGYLVAGQLKTRITKIVGSDLFFEIPGDDDSITVFKEDVGTLQQNPKHESLWLKVKEFPVNDLPIELLFDDPIKGPSGKGDVVSCYTRLSYLGRLGPSSNIVHAIKLPHVPEVPPPFSVELLGIDFYNRTMIKIRFTETVTGGMYSVWWADDALTSNQFPVAGVPGLYGGQNAYQNRILYDVLSLPIPRLKSRTVTIGVQEVNEGRGQSNFQTVQVTLKPPV